MCLTVLGYAFMCLTVLGYVSMCLTVLGYVFMCLTVLGYASMCLSVRFVYMCLTVLDYVSMCLTVLGYVSICPTVLGYVSTSVYHSVRLCIHVSDTVCQVVFAAGVHGERDRVEGKCSHENSRQAFEEGPGSIPLHDEHK